MLRLGLGLWLAFRLGLGLWLGLVRVGLSLGLVSATFAAHWNHLQNFY